MEIELPNYGINVAGTGGVRHKGYTEQQMRAAIAAAVAKEREACAEVCDTVATKMQSHKNGFALSQPVKDNLTGHIDGAKTCAADIRARTSQQQRRPRLHKGQAILPPH